MSGVTEAATAAAPNSTPAAQAQAAPQMYIRPYASAGYKPVVTSPPPLPELLPPGAIIIKHVNSNPDPKRKRGRPRKYGPDSGVVSPQQPVGVSVPPQNFSSPPEQMESRLPVVGESAAGSTFRKAMGRPRGSKNKKQRTTEILGSNGNKLIPHILTVQPGEDVAQKIMAFCHSGPRAVCILSGTGAIASVALSQAATSGGTATYEGRFEILSLSGSFIPTETGDHRSRSGGLSITLVGSGGRVFGGSVSSFLIAATPVQMIVGSFVADGYGEPRLPNHMEPSSANLGGSAGFGSSPSQGTQSESSGEPVSHHNLGSSAFNNVPQGMLWK